MRTVADPYVGAATVTPSDSAKIRPTRAIMVGVSGNVAVDMRDGSTVTISGLNAGVIYDLSVTRVYGTGTTATGIIALY